MPRKNHTKKGFLPFEAAKTQDSFVAITKSLYSSSAWRDLSLRQQGLYLYLRSKVNVTVKGGVRIMDNTDNISLPYAEWHGRLYGDGDTFRKDMKALYDHGFIVLKRSGKATRPCNLYGFSADWQEWEPPNTNKNP